jgi:hypothetical protein
VLDHRHEPKNFAFRTQMRALRRLVAYEQGRAQQPRPKEFSAFCFLHSAFCILHSTFYILHSTFLHFYTSTLLHFYISTVLHFYIQTTVTIGIVMPFCDCNNNHILIAKWGMKGDKDQQNGCGKGSIGCDRSEI